MPELCVKARIIGRPGIYPAFHLTDRRAAWSDPNKCSIGNRINLHMYVHTYIHTVYTGIAKTIVGGMLTSIAAHGTLFFVPLSGD
jgi:hypothetical protein